ncbi:YciI family protein [Rhizobium sp. 3T7]|uniref:YciI family protein n=1 Tax=Rhizobium sp. 3T7 TaxID=2874922 RepID=UPI001CCEE362|nr:YciI family protein [Rhizobium sp. 3T7]MBZ9790629.1 YciI family protein [Rhizobium sp. 3T7]
MAYFFLRLVPPRLRFPHDATGEEMAAMKRHVTYWHQNAKEGSAIAVGPVFEGEGAWGMAVVSAVDQKAAQALADADPIIQSGYGFRFDILPMPSIILRPSVAGNE